MPEVRAAALWLLLKVCPEIDLHDSPCSVQEVLVLTPYTNVFILRASIL